MTRDETIARFMESEAKRAEARAAALAAGESENDAREIAHEAAKAHWNAWAEDMLAKRKALENSGAWVAEKSRQGRLEPQNAQTRAWLERAEGNFCQCEFVVQRTEGSKEKANAQEPPIKSIVSNNTDIDFRGFVFPGNAQFNGATFAGLAWFTDATFSGKASFGNATFSNSTSFGGTTFLGNASFSSAIFSGNARFDNTTFRGVASFSAVSFYKDSSFRTAEFWERAEFDSVSFFGETIFNHARFSKWVRFDGAKFRDDARFWGTHFLKEAQLSNSDFTKDAIFNNASFESRTFFTTAIFKKHAEFIAVKADRAFDLTGAAFSKVPAFNQADFKQAPDLDAAHFPLPRFWSLGDPALIAKYRAIRRIAIQGADYEREQMAFKGELRSRRWTTDKLRHPGLWLGIFYDAFADCGRSIVRPAALWLLSVAAFAVMYLRMADPAGWTCGTPFVKALFLSGRNGLVLFSGSRDARIAQAYQCLYGGGAEPDIPDAVSFLEAFVQVPLSAVLIFLFLLAVKNRFKIK